MSELPSILVIEDDKLLNQAYGCILEQKDCEVRNVFDGQSALAELEKNPPDILLLDLLLPDMNGGEILKWINDNAIHVKTIVITTEASAETAVKAMRLGANDYLIKPVNEERLTTTVGNFLEHISLEKKLKHYQDLKPGNYFESFIGGSSPMQVIYRIIENAASSDASIFVTGESGTGKELCAEAIHHLSSRKEKPLVVLNCAAIPRDLMESELFGHSKGAFTGATSSREGAATRAEGGTLFFDEVCELELELQSKLLRFIQTRQYQPVGSNRQIQSDIRFICATNRDPWEEVKAGRFREDLYYRLYVVPISMPRLKDRNGDIMVLAQHFLDYFSKACGKKFTGFTQAAEQLLRDYHWPGNVRELENTIHNLVILNSKGGLVKPAMLQLLHDRGIEIGDDKVKPTNKISDTAAIRPLWQEERDIIERAVRYCNGNISKAAKELDISDTTIYRKKRLWDNAS